MECAFLHIEIQVTFPKLFKDRHKMLEMFSQVLGVYKDVVIVPSMCHIVSLPLVPLPYLIEVVCAFEVQLGEECGSTKQFQGGWNE